MMDDSVTTPELGRCRWAEIKTMQGREQRLLVISDRTMYWLEPRTIQWISASGNYVEIHTHAEMIRARMPLHEIETRLGSAFIRVSRSALVALEHIVRARHIGRMEYLIVMRNGDQVRATRQFPDALREHLGVFARVASTGRRRQLTGTASTRS